MWHSRDPILNIPLYITYVFLSLYINLIDIWVVFWLISVLSWERIFTQQISPEYVRFGT